VTPCTYSAIGEINGDLRRMIKTQFGDNTLFSVHSDDAPNVYVNGTASQPIRDPNDPVVRNLEREMTQLSWQNPYTGLVENGIMVRLADKAEMDILHMVTSDPWRTPTFTPFADPEWFFFATGGATPNACNVAPACVTIPPPSSQTFAWNHGDIQEEIATTWVGYVGPGVKNLGTASPWTDHTDVRPTMLSLLGLKDDYRSDGRVTWEILNSATLPSSITSKQALLTSLAEAYKQINAPFGDFSMTTLDLATKGAASSSTNDHTYQVIDTKLADLNARRDALALQISQALGAAEFDGTPIATGTANSLLSKANDLLQKAHDLDASF